MQKSNTFILPAFEVRIVQTESETKLSSFEQLHDPDKWAKSSTILWKMNLIYGQSAAGEFKLSKKHHRPWLLQSPPLNDLWIRGFFK